MGIFSRCRRWTRLEGISSHLVDSNNHLSLRRRLVNMQVPLGYVQPHSRFHISVEKKVLGKPDPADEEA